MGGPIFHLRHLAAPGRCNPKKIFQRTQKNYLLFVLTSLRGLRLKWNFLVPKPLSFFYCYHTSVLSSCFQCLWRCAIQLSIDILQIYLLFYTICTNIVTRTLMVKVYKNQQSYYISFPLWTLKVTWPVSFFSLFTKRNFGVDFI